MWYIFARDVSTISMMQIYIMPYLLVSIRWIKALLYQLCYNSQLPTV